MRYVFNRFVVGPTPQHMRLRLLWPKRLEGVQSMPIQGVGLGKTHLTWPSAITAGDRPRGQGFLRFHRNLH